MFVRGVRTASGSDPIKTNVRADPVATAPGSDTETALYHSVNAPNTPSRLIPFQTTFNQQRFNYRIAPAEIAKRGRDILGASP